MKKKTSPSFSATEKSKMLALKGVGETVISRLEQIGFSSLSELRNVEVAAITKPISEMMNSSCWHHSPMAKNAIAAIIALANEAGKDSADS